MTNQALLFRRRFERWGWSGEDVAVYRDPRLASAIGPLAALRPDPEDVLLYHYAAYAPGMRATLTGPNPKVMLFHNVTPSRWLWRYYPALAVQCEVGRTELPEFAAAARVALADSEHNADELRAAGATDVGVLPILFDPAPLGPPRTEEPSGSPHVLFVGRLVPNKRQDELIRMLALLRRHHHPDARLTLVGAPLSDGYRASLAGLAERLVPGAVTFAQDLSVTELGARYRAASAFVCLSEHEGFCIPLLEAFHAGVPVIARRVGGVTEVGGDAILGLEESDDAAVAAEALAVLLGDAELRAELRDRGRRRLGAFAPEATERTLRAAVERAGGV